MSALVNKVRSNPLGSVDAASFQFAIVSGESFSFNHGFAARPRHVDLYIVCVVANVGYAVGDKVKISDSADVSIAVGKFNCTITAAALPLIVSPVDSAAAAITAADWNWFATIED